MLLEVHDFRVPEACLPSGRDDMFVELMIHLYSSSVGATYQIILAMPYHNVGEQTCRAQAYVQWILILDS